jgi:putative membrane protein
MEMLSPADNERIVAAIRTAEASTSGEIYCVIAHACGAHHLVPIAWAALLAFAVALPLIYFTNLPAAIIYLAQLGTFIVTAAILSVPRIRYRVVPKRRLFGRAHVVAVQQFLAQGIHLTDKRTGVLIFASMAERYAEIIADRGINAKVSPDVWAGAITEMISAIKQNRAADGFITAIARCGEVLARHFPPGELNRNELPDRVVEI